MTTEIVYRDSARELDAFVASHPKGHFLQTSVWGKVKDDWQWFGVIARDASGEIKGTLAVLARRISKLPYHMLYAPRGPVCCLHDAETFNALVDAAKAEGKKLNGYMLKIDTDALASDEEYAQIIKQAGFVQQPRFMNFEGYQCRFVYRLDISGKTEDEVFAAFASKHRYNVRVALKHNVEIRRCGSEAAEDFYRIMQETGERDGFAIRTASYFAKIIDTFGEDCRLNMAYYEGKPIAGTLCVHWGNKVWYFYGASLNSHRNVMPNYLLQWTNIRWAISLGCDIYDFRGVSGIVDENNGLYRFKKGFSGDMLEFMGEADLTIDAKAKKAVEAAQKLAKILRR
ncbi:MAG: peptidoglycan bridge formation glycyltransferase FemA/FemB family protein [Clostridia bacterium]|nr:peptidoglycan bridge formation glycyltransferase FemA/FemB family protein [Clostridia bacterium]